VTAALEHYLADLAIWGSAFSLFTLLAVLVAVPWIVRRLPADYFSEPRRHPLDRRVGLWGVLLAGLKNLLGALLVAMGIIMLFTPGQGLLTLLAGLLLMNFPGKYRLEQALVAREQVFRGLNWMRRRHGLPPFEAPPE